MIFGALGAIDRVQSDSHKTTTYRLAWVGPRDTLLEKDLRTHFAWAEDLRAGDPEGLTLTLPADHVAGTPAVLKVSYNSTRQDLSWAYGAVTQAVEAYNETLSAPAPKPLTVSPVDLAKPEAQGAGLMAFLLPYLVVLFLFAGSMNLGLAVTVMEKEKGSLALLLVNQVSRTSIALGKVLFVVVSGLVNTLTSGIGMVVGAIAGSSLDAATS